MTDNSTGKEEAYPQIVDMTLPYLNWFRSDNCHKWKWSDIAGNQHCVYALLNGDDVMDIQKATIRKRLKCIALWNLNGFVE